ncbi:transport and Golgi organization protein 6 homolog isoform X2 [Mya arenaria]|uniref:transport and Golgi organization protein 6 homolog isoform X2 n=1 Tax=Mya arenaria TaxID=6604 RepID=UPI0022E696B2|nr:transport and Golgi organization protein 6 homolog isoform X2 [Mya arenaria]
MLKRGSKMTSDFPPPSSVLSALQNLTAQASKPTDLTQPLSLHSMLSTNIEAFNMALTTNPELQSLNSAWEKDSSVEISLDGPSTWSFVQHCLKCLHLLNLSITESISEFENKTEEREKKSALPEMSPDTLSFQDQKLVSTSVQFVVCLGICPNLELGVGVPLELRSGFSKLVKYSESCDNVSQDMKELRLFQCIKVLSECVVNPALSTLILTQHLADLLAGLMQLNYFGFLKYKRLQKCTNKPGETSGHQSFQNMNPATVVDFVKKQTEMDAKHETSRVDNNDSCSKESNLASQDVKDYDVDYVYCKTTINELMKKVYPPLLVKTLLMLQGGPKPKNVINKPTMGVAPVWLRRECGRHLTAIVMRPQGVQSVLRGLLDAPGAGTGLTESADWRKCEAVAKVIACCPLTSQSRDQYYSIVAPQVLELLHIPDVEVRKQFQRVACSTIIQMWGRDPDLTSSHLLQPLMWPLVRCTQAMLDKPPGCVVIVDKELCQCIEDCHKVFAVVSVECPGLVVSLQPVILVIYSLLTFSWTAVNTLKSVCQELITTFLKHSDLEVALTCLKLMTFNLATPETEASFPRMHPDLMFTHSDEGNVNVEVKENESEAEALDEDAPVQCVVSLLKNLEQTGVAGEFLVFLLQELTSIIQSEVSEPDEATKQASRMCDGQVLLDIEQRNKSVNDQFHKKLAVMNVLASACEVLGPECIQNAQQTLKFVKATLLRAVELCRNTDDMQTGIFEGETITMAMGLLTALMTGAFQLTDTDRQSMQELLPLLQDIGANHPETSVQDMANDIRIAIATHGAVWSELGQKKGGNFSDISEKVKEEKKKVNSKAAYIEVLQDVSSETTSINNEDTGSNTEETVCSKCQDTIISEHSDHRAEASGKTSVENNVEKAGKEQRMDDNGADTKDSAEAYKEEISIPEDAELELAFKELCDPLIPVRGHGLIRLTHLVQERQKAVESRSAAIMKIFEENLDHGDSYIYLSAVNGLSVMCDVFPETSVPRVCHLMSNLGNNLVEGQRSPELMMKLGEILVKASRSLGDMIPAYRDVILRSVMVGVHDDDPLVQASCLSSLGELCKHLHFSLGNVIHEVLECCSSTLGHSNAMVRKAAAQVLFLLLQGLGNDVFKVLETVIRDLYRLLKHVILVEKDEGVKLHVQLALNVLDDIMRANLFPEQKLEKRIRVLDFD